MTTPTLKIKITPAPKLRGKMDVRFPANVEAISPIILDKSGGTYTISFDASSLSGSFATVEQGALAETALQSVAAGSNVTVDNSDPQNPIISAAVDYATNADVEATDVPSSLDFLRTAGYSTAGDGGGALYMRVISEPSHAGKIQSNDGAWWELSELTVNPVMFGAVGDGLADDQPALQAMHDFCESRAADGFRHKMQLLQNNYAIASTWTLRPTATFNLWLEGSGAVFGTRITAKAAFTGTPAVLLEGQTDAIEMIANFNIGGFDVIAEAGTTATVGVWVGGSSAGKNLIGVQQSSIHDIYVNQFQINWVYNQARLVHFERCSGWHDNTLSGAINLKIQLSDASLFTGDADWTNCQFVSATGTNRCNVYITHGNTGQIKGLRFHSSILYKADYNFRVDADGGAQIGDIWLTGGTQIDGVLTRAVYLNVVGGAATVIDDVHVEGAYIRGFTASAIETLVTAGSIRSIFFDRNWFANGSGNVAIFGGAVAGVHFTNNILDECSSAGALVDFTGAATDLKVIGNTLRRISSAAAVDFIKFGASVDRFSAIANTAMAAAISGLVINDGSASSSAKTIIDNVSTNTFSSAVAVTAQHSSALVVGRQGATSPAFHVDSSAASSVTGVKVTAAAAGSRSNLAAISSGTNEGLSIDAKGSGSIRFGATSTGQIEFSRNAVPTASDGAALGTTSLMWADAFLASGAVVNYNNGDYTVTHSTGILTYSGSLILNGSLSLNTSIVPGTNVRGFLGGSFGFVAPAYGLQGNLYYDGAWKYFSNGRGGNIILGQASDAQAVVFQVAANNAGGAGASATVNDAMYISTNGVVNVSASTATPAGGSTSARLLFGTTSGFGIYYGSGAPTVSAAQGSLYLRSDGSSTSTRLYINTNGSTTWTAVTTGA